MATLKFINKLDYSYILIDGVKLIGHSTKSLYIRKGKINGKLFLSQRGNGCEGAGDICDINKEAEIIVHENLFERIRILAKKANALI